MSILANIYYKSISENEKKLRFWEDYLQNLKSLNFESYAEKLKVPVLVPIGSRILFRGELKHTNEVTVALGADYFVKCSLKQAEVLRQHRIKDAESNLQSLHKEREYLENQVSFGKQTVFDDEGQEIIEVHNEEEDKMWREKHRENVRKWKQNKTDKETNEGVNDEELWERLEELELQEELENELSKEHDPKQKNNDSLIVNKEDEWRQDAKTSNENEVKEVYKDRITENTLGKKVAFVEETKPTGKLELLQKVRDKQYELEEKLMELRYKDRGKSKTEEDLIAKLDEMDELEDLQDEMYRLVEMIATTEDKKSDESEDELPSITDSVDIKRRVSFADDDDAETLEVTFQHSDEQPSTEPYDSKKGITKPSDIYEAYSNLFGATKSILKKTKYEDKKSNIVMPLADAEEMKNVQWPVRETKTIVVKDVVEKVDVNDNTLENEKRPMSLFKQRRQQKK